MSNWTEEKEKKILTKYRFTLTFRILRITIAVLIAYFLVVSGMKWIIIQTTNPLKYAHDADTMLLITEPNIHIEYRFWVYPEIDSFFTQTIKYPIYKKVGNGEIEIGEVELKKKLFQRKPTMTVNKKPQYSDTFEFYLPEDPTGGTPLDAPETPGQWEKLEKVHEGTVAEMAFSMDRYYSMEELLTLLEGYDIHVLWMPLNVGEENFARMYSGGGEEGSSHYIPTRGLGIGRVSTVDEEYRHSMTYVRPGLDGDGVVNMKEVYLYNLQMLVKENGIQNHLLNQGYLEKYYKWIQENDFQVYGAVVTGPVKELLQLKEIEGLRAAQVGDVTFWNWNE